MNIKSFISVNGAMPRMRVTGVGAAGATSSTPAIDREQRFEDAMALMEAGDWKRAFTSLAQLADAGHPQAARIAMVFVRRGASLFGGTFSAGARQRECWLSAGR